MSPNRGVLGGDRRGNPVGRSKDSEDEDGDEYTTWLTEDKMDWGGGAEAPPPVLGARPRQGDTP